MLISIAHDYGDNQYPSKDFPYFTSGRLLAGLFPLLAALWIDGLAVLSRSTKLASILLTGWLITNLVSEWILMQPVIESVNNFWHLDVKG